MNKDEDKINITKYYSDPEYCDITEIFQAMFVKRGMLTQIKLKYIMLITKI